jgi:hypothetical protein
MNKGTTFTFCFPTLNRIALNNDMVMWLKHNWVNVLNVAHYPLQL